MVRGELVEEWLEGAVREFLRGAGMEVVRRELVREWLEGSWWRSG